MPIPKPTPTETESEFVSRCISEISGEYEQEQGLAICYETYRSENLQTEEEIQSLPEPKETETMDKYLRRCIPTLYKAGGKYDQRTATAMCADKYEGKSTLLKKKKDSFSSVASKIKMIKLEDEPSLEDACWPGWKALGTKILDGKEVPNCIPEEEHPDFKD